MQHLLDRGATEARLRADDLGLEQIEDKALKESMTSSRELVADVIVEALGRETLPESPLAFVDGDNPVSSIK